MKLNVVPVDLKLLAASIEADGGDSDSGDLNLDNIDPNQLLNDENILKKLSEDNSGSKSKK